MKNNPSEIQLQASVFQKLWNEYPETRYSFFAVPNGGTRNPIEAMQLKASGLVPGVADTILLWNGKAYAAEFKTLKGKLRDAQIKFREQCERQNIPYVVIRTEEQFWEWILPIIDQRNQISA
ncbi:VRR-NUC domain-containing protein [Pontibacter qinzhouensis]|uniref:VRR-NUC domain-containing protein n=1 Tax=Pontibacter qinzhouensis TaxID=2603253 RepID=A0A5C8KB87_9BACT|nr:VRR-NUC domain-containing protein [Pontibacter qinzhouensis]TXK52359.1 VRR-NUC domain-containing protein [Pontibacter qinzhouensis]